MIEIVRHVGDDGVELDQNRVFVDGRVVGYCGIKPDCPINFIVRVSEETAALVADAVRKQVGASNKVSYSPVLVDEKDADDLDDAV